MTLELVREKYKEKLSDNNLNANDKRILNLIGDLLKDNMCFIKINIDLSLSMLLFLGYEKDEAKKVYTQLINEAKQQLTGKYTLFPQEDIKE